MTAVYYYDTPVGKIGIGRDNGRIAEIFFGTKDIDAPVEETELHRLTITQLYEYFSGKRKLFDIPVSMRGTQFRQKVWSNLTAVPYGSTVTYKQVAEQTGSPNAARAVGGACNKNLLPIIIPCHRVIGSNGNLTGYAGGLHIKKFLIDLEKK